MGNAAVSIQMADTACCTCGVVFSMPGSLIAHACAAALVALGRCG